MTLLLNNKSTWITDCCVWPGDIFVCFGSRQQHRSISCSERETLSGSYMSTKPPVKNSKIDVSDSTVITEALFGCSTSCLFHSVRVCVRCRPDPGPEDRDSEEGGTTVLNEDVYGLQTLLYLQNEVENLKLGPFSKAFYSFYMIDTSIATLRAIVIGTVTTTFVGTLRAIVIGTVKTTFLRNFKSHHEKDNQNHCHRICQNLSLGNFQNHFHMNFQSCFLRNFQNHLLWNFESHQQKNFQICCQRHLQNTLFRIFLLIFF